MNWMEKIKVGDYVQIISLENPLEVTSYPVTKVTKRSVFVDRMQFSKDTGIQKNKKRKIEPFMAHHHK